MFGRSRSKPDGERLMLTIDGMHCPSCSMNIDGELEDLDGVNEASTNYAKSTSQVIYDPKKVSITKIEKAVKKLGYAVTSSQQLV